MQQICLVPKHIRSFIKISCLVFMIGLTGCTTTNLQNLAVEGPMFQPPVHLTKDSTRTFQLHPWISWVSPNTRSGRVSGHTMVNSNGVYQVDTIKTTTPYQYQERTGTNDSDFQGTNFQWTLPSNVAGLDMDIALSSSNAISIGGSFASMDSGSYWQAHISIGSMSHWEHTSARVDLGVEWQNQKYDADFVHTTVTRLLGPDDVEFLSVHQNQTQVNYFISAMINGSSEKTPVNFFLQAAVVRQSLFYISDETGSNAALNDNSETHYLYSLTPGVSLRIASQLACTFGVRFIWDASTQTPATTTYQPLVQIDWGL